MLVLSISTALTYSYKCNNLDRNRNGRNKKGLRQCKLAILTQQKYKIIKTKSSKT